MHSLVAMYQNHVRRHANIFKNWDKVMKVSMCARTTVCCFGVIVRNYKRAQNAESRWEDVDGSRRVPHRVLRHFPLILRLQRVFAARGIVADAEWHKTK